MNIRSCLYPVKIRNKYTNEILHVPCRKCYACRLNKQMEFVNRLQFERTKWKYCIFFTLTYAPEYVPYFRLERDGKDIIFTRENYVSSFHNGICFEDTYSPDGDLFKCFSLSELDDALKYDDRSKLVIEKALLSDSQFRVVDKRHVQTFIKRLRFHVDKYYNHAKLRYFVVSEYGCDKTDNLRPHYHGLLFTDSKEFTKDAYKVLCETWKLGFVGASLARHSAASYVAKYITGLASYAKIYDIADARPFSLYSRKPAIGVYEDTDPQVKEIVLNGVNDITLYVKTSINVVPFWRSIESRFFPKCREFNTLSHSDRVRKYTPLSQHDWVTSSFLKETNLFVSDEDLSDDRVARRVSMLCDIFNVSLDWYVHRIEDYYTTKALLSLSKFYEYQVEVSRKSDDAVNQLVNCYPQAVEEFRKWWQNNVLPSVDFCAFGVDPFEVDTYLFNKFKPYFKLDSFSDWLSFDFSKFDIKNSSEYNQFKSKVLKRFNDGLKTKKLNFKRNVI